MSNLPDVQYWVKDKNLSKTDTSDYWNNELEEKSKDWYVESVDDLKAKNYIRKKGLEDAFEKALSLTSKNKLELNGAVLDIAAGVGYTSALISKFENIKKVYCLDISKHRLEKLAPIIFHQYNAENLKIYRIVGSFYDIRLPDKSIDVVIMAQAFHHALEPTKMLKEINRVLKDNGYVIVTGEQVITKFLLLKKFIRTLAIDFLDTINLINNKRNNKFRFSIRDLFPADQLKGDTHYTLNMVKSLVEKNGFSYIFHKYKFNNKTQCIYFFLKSNKKKI